MCAAEACLVVRVSTSSTLFRRQCRRATRIAIVAKSPGRRRQHTCPRTMTAHTHSRMALLPAACAAHISPRVALPPRSMMHSLLLPRPARCKLPSCILHFAPPATGRLLHWLQPLFLFPSLLRFRYARVGIRDSWRHDLLGLPGSHPRSFEACPGCCLLSRSHLPSRFSRFHDSLHGTKHAKIPRHSRDWQHVERPKVGGSSQWPRKQDGSLALTIFFRQGHTPCFSFLSLSLSPLVF